jgi:HAE1 family hydrophobic/amphiphilic exporter-1
MRAAVLALAVLGAAAAQAEPLTRAEAVRRALDANPTVRRSLEDVDAYGGRVKEELAAALPELTLVGNGTRFRDPSLLNSPSFDSFPPELRDSLRPFPANLFDGAVQLRQTLFSFKIGKAVRAARLSTDLADQEVKRARQSVALLAVRAYNEYVVSLEKAAVAQKAVRQKERHAEMAQNRRTAGVATELDVLRSRVDLENARTVLLRLRGGADIARARLNAVMVRPVDTPIEPADGLAYVPFEVEAEEAVRAAWSERPEAKAIVLSERIYDELVGVAAAEHMPSLEFFGAYGWSTRETGNFFEGDFSRWSAAVTLTVPVFDGFRTRGKVAQARAERNKVTQDRVALENQIRLEAREAVDRLTVARSVLEAAELNVSQAARALEMTEANYRYGAATTLDVLDAQAALTVAESTRIEGLFEHANARATLRYVMAQDPLDPVAPPATDRTE